ncbi:branched-chain amino acid aminotransferase [Clostridium saccharoperbutylacetonicum]|uniref:Aminotransferase, class IV n=1 Tax=Clostridium saccharoperbutylacetonicum N1-4(HMT) TaxID=931276 RepID=M1MQ83_9CLOT|nr:aminotransferase class IV [Clostridium saccharoperbutylacetonicum]AGF58348.1 aminotransferase, class IV [Clostridium saccharoperbutylacetonicum N1-4(HMT)]NRT60874.1 branched-chain amino acid aminotransferase [Clostridium saccharoperbutylacetonicum]NSB24188.1 branched-chain amino acid aminotransferase [Clostridium saccharoperbutylacetonicum]NSB43566.1 branched-chain amino acid aminotransferase [Clostridium saccharoperbutylacetonicum]
MEEKIIYEVLRVLEGKPLFLENHLRRMKNSFELINENFKITYDEISEKIKELIKSEKKVEGNIKITYSVNEKLLRIFFIEHSYPSSDMYKDGVKTILYFAERENPNAKIINTTFRERINNEIRDKNVYEAILVDSKGNITEGSRSNIFMVKDNILITSPLKKVLPGVTRGEVIEIALRNGIEVKEEEFKASDIGELDGMFISGTSPKILPISKVDNINFNINNDLIRKLIEEYNHEIDSYIKMH